MTISRLKILSASLALAVMLASCNNGPKPNYQLEKDPDETATSGQLHFVMDDVVEPLIKIEAQEFMRIYEKSKLTYDVASAGSAIVDFINGKERLIVVSRKFNAREDSVVQKYNLSYISKTVALDAVCIIVNPKNPVDSLKLSQFRDILSGKIKDWQQVGSPLTKGSQPITVFATGINSGQRQFIKDTLLVGTDFAKEAYPCSTTVQMLDFVKSRRDAIGYVGMAYCKDYFKKQDSTIKVIALATDTANAVYRQPYQAYVYRGEYPLTYPIYVVYTGIKAMLPRGFNAFITSTPGQKIFMQNGLVPQAVPVRLVQLGDDSRGR
jgi:phosphate transport system substrate-binding protein